VASSAEGKTPEKTSGDNTFVFDPMTQRHHSVLLEAIAGELQCDVEDIHDFEL
jgi:hypothetical protein